jgi:type I restriction enzyme S subunit
MKVSKQPQRLPHGWIATPIGDICILVNGRAFKPVEWSDAGTPIIRIQDLRNPDTASNYSQCDVEDKYHVKGGDLRHVGKGTKWGHYQSFKQIRHRGAIKRLVSKTEEPRHEPAKPVTRGNKKAKGALVRGC